MCVCASYSILFEGIYRRGRERRALFTKRFRRAAARECTQTEVIEVNEFREREPAKDGLFIYAGASFVR